MFKQETIDILRDIDTVIDIRQVSDKRKKDYLDQIEISQSAGEDKPLTHEELEALI